MIKRIIKIIKKLLFNIWLKTITINKYKKYLKDNDVIEEDMCYNVDKHQCDARCQGGCGCLFAQGLKVSRKEMMIQEIGNIESGKDWELIKKSKEFKNMIKKMMKK